MDKLSETGKSTDAYIAELEQKIAELLVQIKYLESQIYGGSTK